MGRFAAVLATVAVGALIAFQPPVNSELAKRTSVLGGAFIGLLVSAVLMGMVVLASGDIGQLKRIGHVPVIYLSGGLLGAALVTVSLVTVRTLGAGGVVAATVLGQLAVSAVLDRFGVLGLERVGLTGTRLLGFGLLLSGTVLVTVRR